MSDKLPWRRRTGPLAAVALVSGLVAGGIGGTIGYHLADDDPPVRSAFELPAAGKQLVDLPAGSIAQVAQRVLPSVVKLQIEDGPQVGSEAVW